MGTILRDPICEYIELNELEHALLSTKQFQRLRHVLQSATSFLTYPSSTHTRFTHSLGVAHYAGIMANNVFSYHFPTKGCFLLSIYNSFAEWLVASSTNYYIIRNLFSPPHLIALCKTICRLIGMLHDIGHPPFSHLTEGLLTRHDIQHEIMKRLNSEEDSTRYFCYAFNKKYGALHEALGLFTLMEPDIVQAFQNTSLSYFKSIGIPDCAFVYDILINILFPDNNNDSICHFFHSIIDSDIGADRIDYISRDGYSTGIGMGKFDSARILSNLRVFNISDSTKPQFFVFPSVKAKSAVEALLIERFKLHCYLYYHHRVIQTDEILRLLLSYIFRLCSDSEMLCNGLSIGEYIEFDPGKFSCGKSVEYGICLDDSYVWHAIHKLYALTNPEHPLPSQSENIRTRLFDIMRKHAIEPNLVIRLIEAIIHRRSIAFSCWKDYQGMMHFERSIEFRLKEGLLASWRASTKKADPTGNSKCDLNSIADEYFFKDSTGSQMIGDFERYINCKLGSSDITLEDNISCKYFVIVTYRKFRAYEVDGNKMSKLKYITRKDDSEYEELNIVSPIVNALKDAYNNMPHLYIYILPYNFKGTSNGTEDINMQLFKYSPNERDFQTCLEHFQRNFSSIIIDWMNSCVEAKRSKFREESLIPVLN